jgi:uncharacterized protein (DUF58 family)
VTRFYQTEPMLTRDLIKTIKRIQITSRRVVDSVMAGHYRSAFRGTGMEFEEYREYSPGDEIRNIDWQVTARLGRPYVKRFREERELQIMLLVDLSASGRFGTGERLKQEAMVDLAALLALCAIRNNDKIGAILFTDHVERHIAPQKGSGHVWRVIREILNHQPKNRGTDISAAAGFLAKVARKRSVAFLVSDFLDTGYLPSLKRVAQRHDLIAALISDPGDFTLPRAGLVEVEDLETGRRQWLDASRRPVREAYARHGYAFRERMLTDLKSARIDCINLTTDASPADELYRFFRVREKRLGVFA